MTSNPSDLHRYFGNHSSIKLTLFAISSQSLKLQSQKNKEKNVYPAEAGQLPVNKKKNRFKDILPCKICASGHLCGIMVSCYAVCILSIV